MTGFGLGAASGLKEISPDQFSQWDFGNFFVPFGLPKIIVMDVDGLFAGMFKKTFQETLIIPVHAVKRENHTEIRNEGFHRYLEKAHKINSYDKGSLKQWLQGVFFVLYAWNTGPVEGTDTS